MTKSGNLFSACNDYNVDMGGALVAQMDGSRMRALRTFSENVLCSPLPLCTIVRTTDRLAISYSTESTAKQLKRQTHTIAGTTASFLNMQALARYPALASTLSSHGFMPLGATLSGSSRTLHPRPA